MSNIEAILTKGVFRDIKHETAAIRSNNKDLDFADSIYDGRTVSDENKEFTFDDEVVNSKIYRETLKKMRKESTGFRPGPASIGGAGESSGGENCQAEW